MNGMKQQKSPPNPRVGFLSVLISQCFRFRQYLYVGPFGLVVLCLGKMARLAACFVDSDKLYSCYSQCCEEIERACLLC